MGMIVYFQTFFSQAILGVTIKKVLVVDRLQTATMGPV
jgi:hypothetical protein